MLYRLSIGTTAIIGLLAGSVLAQPPETAEAEQLRIIQMLVLCSGQQATVLLKSNSSISGTVSLSTIDSGNGSRKLAIRVTQQPDGSIVPLNIDIDIADVLGVNC